MNMDDKKIFNLIRKALKTDKNINNDSSSKNIDEWDSLGHLSILTALDKITKGKTSKILELTEATSVKKIKILLKKNKL